MHLINAFNLNVLKSNSLAKFDFGLRCLRNCCRCGLSSKGAFIVVVSLVCELFFDRHLGRSSLVKMQYQLGQLLSRQPGSYQGPHHALLALAQEMVALAERLLLDKPLVAVGVVDRPAPLKLSCRLHCCFWSECYQQKALLRTKTLRVLSIQSKVSKRGWLKTRARKKNSAETFYNEL